MKLFALDKEGMEEQVDYYFVKFYKIKSDLFFCLKMYKDQDFKKNHLHCRAPDNFQVKRVITPTFENDGYLHISFALLYSLLQKRLHTCTLLKLCLTQVLFNKRRIQDVKCISV